MYANECSESKRFSSIFFIFFHIFTQYLFNDFGILVNRWLVKIIRMIYNNKIIYITFPRLAIRALQGYFSIACLELDQVKSICFFNFMKILNWWVFSSSSKEAFNFMCINSIFPDQQSNNAVEANSLQSG